VSGGVKNPDILVEWELKYHVLLCIFLLVYTILLLLSTKISKKSLTRTQDIESKVSPHHPGPGKKISQDMEDHVC